MEPFKNFFNRPLIEAMAAHLSRVYPEFAANRFIRDTMVGFENLELKERSRRITDVLETTLPEDFPTSAQILTRALHSEPNRELSELKTDSQGLAGWAVMPMADYVARRGLPDFDLAMATLREMTMRFTAEFAIRPLILADPDRAMKIMAKWTGDRNPHVRRLCSEGTRPRLPWGIRLSPFVEDPSPILPILSKLRNDSSEYVRRSVANNLNDIAKDHPETVLELAGKWHGTNPKTDKLLKHACRTLLKRGDERALALFGFPQIHLERVKLMLAEIRVSVGDVLEFEFQALPHGCSQGEILRLEYAITFQTSQGRESRKVFKISERPWDGSGILTVRRRHSLVDRTVRKHFAGRHQLEMIVNGRTVAHTEFAILPKGS